MLVFTVSRVNGYIFRKTNVEEEILRDYEYIFLYDNLYYFI